MPGTDLRFRCHRSGVAAVPRNQLLAAFPRDQRRLEKVGASVDFFIVGNNMDPGVDVLACCNVLQPCRMAETGAITYGG